MTDETGRRREEMLREEQTPSKLALRAARRHGKPTCDRPVWLVGDTLTDGETARKMPRSWAERWTPTTDLGRVPGEVAEVPAEAGNRRPSFALSQTETSERCPRCGRPLDERNPDNESRAHNHQAWLARLGRG